MTQLARSLTLACFAFSLILAPLHAGDWDQFRGPNATGVSPDSKNLPVEFSTTKNVAWKKKLGTGIACPIISGGRCIETAVTGKKGAEQFPVFGFDNIPMT